MHKSERLFQLTNLLRGRRTAITAKQLAERLGVSERTIYRDIQTLELSGIPIDGEAGVGYRIRYDFELPPLMFDREEILALVLGSRMVKSWADPLLASAAERSLAKINAILPAELKTLADQQSLLVPDFRDPKLPETIRLLRIAIEQQRQIRLQYTRADGEISQRTIDPLGQVYWGGKWTVIGWCHKRQDYRQFRLDRIQTLELLDAVFETSNSHSLAHFLSLIEKPEP
ncbi:helix-turn-helix transcriptional regulator [Oceanobacter mangrovi]|uniref:helix-turn-helix transcriptional regulator n=1 Tax=Oceanobacter mangrovi TaxID=2862510 RepID=UPI001C8E7C90|nr:YafY family protein [Oceanobacter mangrovi]